MKINTNSKLFLTDRTILTYPKVAGFEAHTMLPVIFVVVKSKRNDLVQIKVATVFRIKLD